MCDVMWPMRTDNDQGENSLKSSTSSLLDNQQFSNQSADNSTIGKYRRKSSGSIGNISEPTSESSEQTVSNASYNNNSKRRCDSPLLSSTSIKAPRLSLDNTWEGAHKGKLAALNYKKSPELNPFDLIQKQAMQLAYLHQQHQAAALKTGSPPSPLEEAMQSLKNPLAAAVTAGVLPSNVSALPQMQQLLSQQLLSPQQLQNIMQQRAMSVHQAQQIQDFYRQQQKNIEDIQNQLTSTKQQKDSSISFRNDDLIDTSHAVGFVPKLAKDQQQQMQQHLALQQLMHLQQMQQRQNVAAAALQQQGLAAAVAMAQGRPGQADMTSDIQQLLLKHVTDSASASSGRKEDGMMSLPHLNSLGKSASLLNLRSPERDRRDSRSQELFGGETRDDIRRTSNIISSPESSPESNSTPPLFSRGLCKWPGCDSECSDMEAFRRHLNEHHRLGDKSIAQCRVQMQVVEQLDKQLAQERDRLDGMMMHLRMDGKETKTDSNTSDVETIDGKREHLSSNHHAPSSMATPNIFPGINLPFPTHNGTGRSSRDPNNISLPSSPINGRHIGPFPSSPSLFASHFSNTREGILQGAKRRHSSAAPISSDLTQNQEFYRTADVRPPFTYASLIRQAIIETPDCQMTLNEIYNWFQKKFAYFRRNAPTWKSAIRTNLSLHKCFRRCEDVMGSYWTVDEGEFRKGRHLKRGRPRKYEEKESMRPQSPTIRGRADTVSSQSYFGAPMNLATMQMAFGENPFNHAQLTQAQTMLGAHVLPNYNGFMHNGLGSLSHSLSLDATAGMDSSEPMANLTNSANNRIQSVSPTSSSHSFKDDTGNRDKFLPSQNSSKTEGNIENRENHTDKHKQTTSPKPTAESSKPLTFPLKVSEHINGSSEADRDVCNPVRSRVESNEERTRRESMMSDSFYGGGEDEKPLNLHHNHELNVESPSIQRNGILPTRGSFAMLHDHSVAK